MWLAHGDCNTKYFHSRTLTRWTSNQIERLKINRDEWCFADEQLNQHVMGFFTNLFSTNSPFVDPFTCKGHFLELSSVDRNAFEGALTDVEIRNA